MSTYSTNLALELIGTGEQAGTWGNTTNTNLGTLIEQAISGYVTQAVSTGTDTTITIPNGATGVARNMFIELTGTGGTNTNLIVPANKKLYFIYNNASGAVTVKVSGQTGVSVAAGTKVILVSNGTDIVTATSYLTSGGDVTFSSLTLSGGTANGVLYLNASKVVTSGTALVFDGSNLGLGVTPSAWGSQFKALEAADADSQSFISFNTNANAVRIGTNNYFNGTNTLYKFTGTAGQFVLNGNAFEWQQAASGTGGNTITFTQAMTLDASGNLGVGVTTVNAKIEARNGYVRSYHNSSSINAGYGFEFSTDGGGTDTTIAVISANQDSASARTGSLLFQTANSGAPAERARITSTGNLLVGTTTDVTGLSGVISDIAGNVRNVPSAGTTKTSAYTLAITDIGEFVTVGTSGSIVVPNDVFAAGNAVSLFNNTSGTITVSLSITTAYIAGTEGDKNSVTLAARGLATLLFISPSLCIVTGNVT